MWEFLVSQEISGQFSVLSLQDPSSVPGGGTKMLHATQTGKNKQNETPNTPHQPKSNNKTTRDADKKRNTKTF